MTAERLILTLHDIIKECFVLFTATFATGGRNVVNPRLGRYAMDIGDRYCT